MTFIFQALIDMTAIKHPKLLIAGATGHSGKLLSKLTLEQGQCVSAGRQVGTVDHGLTVARCG